MIVTDNVSISSLHELKWQLLVSFKLGDRGKETRRTRENFSVISPRSLLPAPFNVVARKYLYRCEHELRYWGNDPEVVLLNKD